MEKALNEKLFKDLEDKITKLKNDVKLAEGDTQEWTAKFQEQKHKNQEQAEEIDDLKRLNDKNCHTIIDLQNEVAQK